MSYKIAYHMATKGMHKSAGMFDGLKSAYNKATDWLSDKLVSGYTAAQNAATKASDWWQNNWHRVPGGRPQQLTPVQKRQYQNRQWRGYVDRLNKDPEFLRRELTAGLSQPIGAIPSWIDSARKAISGPSSARTKPAIPWVLRSLRQGNDYNAELDRMNEASKRDNILRRARFERKYGDLESQVYELPTRISTR